MDPFLLIFIFVIAALLGFELITKVPPTLHTPLMSGSNAISGITIVGAIIAADKGAGLTTQVVAFCAIAVVFVHAFSGRYFQYALLCIRMTR